MYFQDAAGLAQLSASIEDVFASGDLPRVAETLAQMRRCLEVVGEVNIDCSLHCDGRFNDHHSICNCWSCNFMILKGYNLHPLICEGPGVDSVHANQGSVEKK